MENKIIKTSFFPKLKDLTVEQLKHRAKWFDVAFWGFFILGVTVFLINGFSSLSLLNGVTILSLEALAVGVIAVISIFSGSFIMLSCLICSVIIEIGRRQIIIEYRLREVTEPMLKQISQLEKVRSN
jgi:hypothetical protein